MNWWEAIILGLVQGLAEFLPISSTAHIILVEYWLGLHFPGLALEIFLHLASLLALLIYFRKDILSLLQHSVSYLKYQNAGSKIYFYFVLYILLATFITGSLGILLKESTGEHLKSPGVISAAFLLTGICLFFVERVQKTKERRLDEMTWKDGLTLGLIQAIAVIPGVSRSGATLIGGLMIGLEKDLAVRFSFFLALPVIAGSSIIALKDWGPEMSAVSWGPLSIAFLASFLASLVGIRWLINFVKRSRLLYFAIYCVFIAAICLIFGEAFQADF